MAAFCQQCSIELWGSDDKDLAGTEADLLYTICEGCGLTAVDKNGMCVTDCLLHHGSLTTQTMQQFVDRTIPS